MTPKIDTSIKLYFYKFLKAGKRSIKVGDIKLIPEYDEYSDMIYWTMDNPNDVSYSHYVLNGHIDELLLNFSKLTDVSFYKKLNQKQKLETPVTIYLSPTDKQKFLELAQKTTKFKYKELSMDIYSFDIYTTFDSDGMYFDISFVCYNPYDTIDKIKLSYKELKEKLDYYKEWDSYFDYIDYLFDPLQEYIWNSSPTIFDKDYMMIRTTVRYFTPDRKEIRIW